MSKVIGTITGLEGTFQVKDAQGNLHEVSNGDKIHEGETVIGDKENSLTDSITVSMNDGSEIFVNGTDSQLFDASLSQEAFAAEETVTQADSLVALLQENGDVETNAGDDIETAAGEGTALSTEGVPANFAAANGGIVDINADLYDRAFSDAIPTADQPPLEVVVVPTPATATLTLNDVNVDEGTEAATIGGSLDQAPTDGPVVFTLNNGATITFGIDYVVGDVVQSTPFSIQGDDVYVDGENYNVSVAGYTGGAEFANIVTADIGTVTISDTVDTTNATLTSELAAVESENSATVTYTMTLDTAPTADETFTFKVDGVEKTITVKATETTGTTTVTLTDPDVFKDVDTIGKPTDLAIADSDGASNYEKLTLVNSATAHTATETVDTTTVTVTETLELNGTYTYTATVNNTPDVGHPLTVTLVGAGATEATITITNPSTSGAENSDIQATSVTTSGGNYEQLEVLWAFGETGLVAEASLVDDILDNNVVSGNLFTNDSLNNEITSVNNVFPDANGLITVTTSAGTLEVYTADFDEKLAGDYVYTLLHATDDLTPSAVTIPDINSIENFVYTVQNSDGSSTNATLRIDIIDDGVVVNPISNALMSATEDNLTLTGVFNTTGADIPPTAVDLSVNLGASDLTYQGQTIYYVEGTNSNVLEAYADVSQYKPNGGLIGTQEVHIFTLTVDPDSDSYTINTYEKVDTTVKTTVTISDIDSLAGGPHEKIYVVDNGDGTFTGYDNTDAPANYAGAVFSVTTNDPSDGNYTINTNNSSLGVNNLWIGEDSFKSTITFDMLVTDKNSVELGFNVKASGVTVDYTVYYIGGADSGLIENANIDSSSLNFTAPNGSYIDYVEITPHTGVFQITAFSFLDGATVVDSTDTINVTVTDSDGDSAAVSFDISFDSNDALVGTGSDDTIVGNISNNTLLGNAGNDDLYGGDGDDDLYGGDGADDLYGEAGNDTIVFDKDDTTIDGGTGIDILLIEDGVTIDFADVAANATSIEVVDLSTNDNSLLNITLGDVFKMTDSADHTLRIDGDDADHVTLDLIDVIPNNEIWTKGAELTDADTGTTYNTYSGIYNSETVTLEINKDIPVDQS
ncbi:hypothetical protein SAMN06313540_1028 [Epsilonproteobacteria bacterium SCGC AD-308-E02]|nr:hypothetical protein SAMN06313540_1028 [Epsilonproteobacteria bacterium SCGC AD-308-E02]